MTAHDHPLSSSAAADVGLLDALAEYAIFSLDEHGRIVTWNAGAVHTFGYNAAEILGHPHATLLDPQDPANREPERNLQTARDGGHVLEEGWYLRKDGTRFFATGMLGTTTDAHGRVNGFVRLLHDDTDRKHREDSVAQLRHSAEAKDKLIRQFIHDLRTPMSAITLWTSLIAEPEAMSPSQLAEALTAIRQSADELQALVEQLASARAAT